MPETQQRIREDLVDELDGEIRTDEVTLGVYATDASLYEIRPRAVVYPRGSHDVVRLLQYASETKIPVIARGGGSGVAGGCLGDGIILDFSRTMRRVLEIDGRTVRSSRASHGMLSIDSSLKKESISPPIRPTPSRQLLEA